MTAPIINSLPLPNWSAEQVKETALLASALLVKGGIGSVAGVQLAVADSLLAEENSELLVRIEAQVAGGFELDASQMTIVFSDFSETDAACSADFRSTYWEHGNP